MGLSLIQVIKNDDKQMHAIELTMYSKIQPPEQIPVGRVQTGQGPAPAQTKQCEVLRKRGPWIMHEEQAQAVRPYLQNLRQKLVPAAESGPQGMGRRGHQYYWPCT